MFKLIILGVFGFLFNRCSRSAIDWRNQAITVRRDKPA
jgi:hypothetical protein